MRACKVVQHSIGRRHTHVPNDRHEPTVFRRVRVSHSLHARASVLNTSAPATDKTRRKQESDLFVD